MYAEHVPVISNAMRTDAEAFKRGVTFVILSIRQAVDRLPTQMEEVDELRARAPSLFGWKRSAYQHIRLNGEALQAQLCAIPLDRPADAIRACLTVPGLGIVKAAFVCQLLGFDVACLDSRNVQREGRKREEYKFTKGRCTQKRIDRLIEHYVGQTFGRAEFYWNAWCDYVASDYKTTGEEISAIHLCLVPADFVPF